MTSIRAKDGYVLFTSDEDKTVSKCLQVAVIRGTHLFDAELSGASLEFAHMRNAKLRGANLSNAALYKADLRDADLQRANLKDANLDNADLRGTHFGGADLTGASFHGALLLGAKLELTLLNSQFLSYLQVPLVNCIDERIYNAVKDDVRKHLNMGDWHSCKTTHCRAGWAVHLAGDEGYALEAQVGPNAAGALIYARSRPGERVPDFYESRSEAWEDIQIRAGIDNVEEL